MSRFLSLSLFCLAETAAAGSLQFTQQGHMVDATGIGVEGTFPLRVSLYTTATGGAPAWTRAFAGIPFQSGFYAVTLGGTDDLGVDLDTVFTGPGAGGLYLGLSFNAGAELSPRQAMSAVPRAATAAVAEAVPTIDASLSCAVAGAVGYDAAAGFRVCDGSGWTTAGGGAPTQYVMRGTDFTESSTNVMAPVPGLTKTFTLAAPSVVYASYDYAGYRAGSHQVTSMVLDGVAQWQGEDITGNVTYAGNHGTLVTTLAAGTHTLYVQYRTPAGVPRTRVADHYDASLKIIVFPN